MEYNGGVAGVKETMHTLTRKLETVNLAESKLCAVHSGTHRRKSQHRLYRMWPRMQRDPFVIRVFIRVLPLILRVRLMAASHGAPGLLHVCITGACLRLRL